jgi:hypothetical protein
MQDGRAKVKQKMRGGRANKCKMAGQKLNKKCEKAEQKNVRWPKLRAEALYLGDAEYLVHHATFE